ncbi:MAG: ADP-ribosylglycohydrolase family protein [bacterium]|nr:ADP-ribosylglycohydrolase family protein [bacterium]
MFKRSSLIAAAVLIVAVAAPVFAVEDEVIVLSKDEFLDKCKGAWVGQMIGVCFGAPYEFRFNGVPMTGELKPWKPERIRGAIGQDDCYVEMTFLMALEKYGLDITDAQAGAAFAGTEYPLWHANEAGRRNVRNGIMPPRSGHPDFNRHADDIDFQIEADLLGILCPGLPRESNRLCDRFGHVMNYGDGVYGGMFVAGMYCAAYLEPSDVGKVIAAGLACIPEESLYHQCVSDVVRWHAESPGDWLATWHKVEGKWQDDVDCMPGKAFNIDAKLNGAYIVMGLLYGEGDMAKTIEIGTRCGQDNDCNPSNSAGVLGCMKGYAALGGHWTDGVAKIADTPFSHTDYSFNALIPACQRMAEAILIRAGGEITDTAYRIPVQTPQPAPLEQWEDQMAILSVPVSPHEVRMWNPAWRVTACGPDMDPGLRSEWRGRESVLIVHPVSEEEPAAIEARLSVPDTSAPALLLNLASDPRGDYVLRVLVDGTVAKKAKIDTKGKWTSVSVDLAKYAGEEVDVRVENRANGWKFEAAYLDSIELK